MAGCGRIVAIDAARGGAMLLVFVSHVTHHFAVSAPDLHWVLISVSRAATPTFLLLSGFVSAHLLSNDTRGTVALTLADRALFLLVVAHALLGLGEVSRYGVAHWLFGGVAMTDAIAVAFFAAILLRNASAAALFRIGIALCLCAWLIATTVRFPFEWARTAARLLFDAEPETHVGAAEGLALVPYVGAFLLGMALSKHVRSFVMAEDPHQLARQLARFGAVAAGLAMTGVLAWMATRYVLPDPVRESPAAQFIRDTLHPRIKHPPSPAYFLFYGGVGLLMLAALFRGWPPRLLLPFRRRLSVIGRASLFCFIVQDWLFLALPRALGFEHVTSVSFWLGYLLANSLLIYMLAAWWDANGNNRFITVGLKVLVRRRSERRRMRIRPRAI